MSLWVHVMLKLNIRQGSSLPLMLHLLNVVFCPYFMLTFHMFHEHGHSPIDYIIIEVGVWIICYDQFF